MTTRSPLLALLSLPLATVSVLGVGCAASCGVIDSDGGLADSGADDVDDDVGSADSGADDVDDDAGFADSGADDVDDDAGSADSGADDVDDDAGSADSGVNDVDDDAGSADSGADDVDDDAGSADSGADDVDDDAGSADSGADDVDDDAGSADSGVNDVDDDAGSADSGADDVDDDAGSADSGADDVENDAGSADSGADDVDNDAGSADSGVNDVDDDAGSADSGVNDVDDGGIVDGDAGVLACAAFGTTEVEPNDTVDQALESPCMSFPGEYTGELLVDELYDVVAFEVTEPVVVEARLSGVELPCSFDSVISVISVTGSGSGYDDDLGEGGCSRIMTALEPGVYVVQVEAWELNDGGPWKLELTTLHPQSPTEEEPNDTSDAANFYQTPFFGVSSDADDIDIVRVSVGEGDSLKAEILDVISGDCASHALRHHLTVTSENGESVLWNEAVQTATGAWCARVGTGPLAGGQYDVAVQAYSAEDAGLYELRVEVIDADDQVDEVEPNDTVGNADAPLAAHNSVRGQLMSDVDVDTFPIDIPTYPIPGTMRLWADDGAACMEVDLSLSLLDDDGAATVAFSDEFTGLCPELNVTLDSDVYFAQLWSSSGATGEYLLHHEFIADAADIVAVDPMFELMHDQGGVFDVNKSSSLVVSGDCTIAAAAVRVDVQHGRGSDVRLEVTSPTGTTVRLQDAPGESESPNVQGLYPVTLTPHEPLSVFVDENADGVWTMEAGDHRSGEAGYVRFWELHLWCE